MLNSRLGRRGDGDGGLRRRIVRTRLEGALLALGVFVATCFSASRLALTWDEGDAFLRAASVARWVEAFVVGPTNLPDATPPAGSLSEEYENELRAYFGSFGSRLGLLSRDALRFGFPHAVCREGHPAGYSIAIALGEWATSPFRGVVSEKLGRRIVGAALFSLALGLVYSRLTFVSGRVAGLTGALCVLFCPRVFAHAQIAGGDSLLISSWLAAWALFPGALRWKRGAVLWGLALGVSFSAKFSGFLIVAPFFAALLVDRFFLHERFLFPRRRRFALFTLGVCVGFAAFFATNPTLWSRPINGLLTFWDLNTRRVDFNIPVYFAGRLYTPQDPPPFWNGFFWVVATTPVPILLLACWGAFAGLIEKSKPKPPIIPRPSATPPGPGGMIPLEIALRNEELRRDEKRLLVFSALALGLTIPIARCFPGLPVHDGARLLIASCAFWGVLAGFGAASLSGYAWRPVAEREFFPAPKRGRRTFAFLCASVCVCVGAIDTIRSAPTYLSFYSGAVGGVTGAFARGFEPTYYWDAFDEGTVERVNAELARRRAEGLPTGVLFGSFSLETLDYYRRWGTLDTKELDTIATPGALDDLSRYGLYVVQFRPSGFTPLDLALMQNAAPIGRTYARNPISIPFRSKKCREKVVILEIYAMEDVRSVLEPEELNAAE